MQKQKGLILEKVFCLSLMVLSLLLTGCGASNLQDNASSNPAIKTTSPIAQSPLKKEAEKRLADAAKKAEEEKKKIAEKQDTTDTETIPRANNVQNIFSEYWLQFLGLVISIIGVVLAVSGFSFSGKKKQKMLKKLMHEIDDAYGSFKQKSKRCEAELYRLQDVIEDNLKEGNIDEHTYQLLEKRIDKYMIEVKDADK